MYFLGGKKYCFANWNADISAPVPSMGLLSRSARRSSWVGMMFERQLAQLLEGTTDAAFTVDLQGEIRTWNKAAENLFGHPASSVVGKECGELLRGRLDARTPVCCQSCDIIECV